jgi:hypothetical protein
MCKGDDRTWWKPRTRTPRQIRTCRPWVTPKCTARTYASGGCTSLRPHRCIPDATLSRMLVTSWATHRRAAVKSSRPSSRTPTAPRSLHGPDRTLPPLRCSYATCSSLQTPNSRRATATSRMLVERATVQQVESVTSHHRHAVSCPVAGAGSL